MDKKAKSILFKMHWTSKGWIDRNNRRIDPSDFAYAKSKGLMFDPLVISFEELAERLTTVTERLSPGRIGDAFLSSLSTQRLEWRSALASYAHARRELDEGILTWHDTGPKDLNVLNFERIKWGGVRHHDSLHNLMDLELLEKDEVPQPTEEDIHILQQILHTIDNAAPKDTPGALRDQLKLVCKGSRQEIGTLLEILGCARILEPLEHNRRSGGEWGYVGQWRGADKYNRQQVQHYFGQHRQT